MNNKSKEIIDFFSSSSLRNCSFYIHCPSLKEEERREISSLILKNQGVNKY
jgi:hypothetical protein